MGQITIFYILSFLATTCSLLVISSKNPVTSAIYLVCDLFILAGIYASLQAEFVAAIQIIVYTGAVVVLFVFVIMLLNLAPNEQNSLGLKLPDIGFTLLTVLSFLIVTLLLVNEQPSVNSSTLGTQEAIAQLGGNTRAVGMTLFTKFVWPFELASFLILAAIIGAVHIAKKDPKPTDKATGNLKASNREKAIYGSP
jgi:NADH-quinone oxidoreductase subunit J